MARFTLDDQTLEQIAQQLPDMNKFFEKVLSLAPDFISMKFDPSSSIPVAAVCLQDATSVLAEARFALHDCLAYKIWYFEKTTPPNNQAGVFFSRFFLDDTALRLYAAGEHLANAIVCMLEFDETKLRKYQAKSVSKQAAVGKYLAKEQKGHPITTIVAQLVRSQAWLNTISYRNVWVHEQPPTISGAGIVYERRKRWTATDSGNGYKLGIGGGDKPTYSIDDVLGFVQPALHVFAATLEASIDFYRSLLEEHGFSFRERGITTRM